MQGALSWVRGAGAEHVCRGVSMLLHECWEVTEGSEAGGNLTADPDRFLGGWFGGWEQGAQVRDAGGPDEGAGWEVEKVRGSRNRNLFWRLAGSLWLGSGRCWRQKIQV